MLIPLGLDDARISRVPWVSLGIAGACLAIYLLTGTHGDGAVVDLCLVPAKGFLQVGWLTAPFAHADWSHVLWNLFYFLLCAPFLEDAWGHRATYVVEPEVVEIQQPRGVIRRMPAVSCAAWLNSDPVNGAGTASELVLVWWTESLGLPIGQAVELALVGVEWERVAKDFDY